MPARPGRPVRQIEFPEKLAGLMRPLGRYRYRVAYGGRGGMKSWSFARSLLLHGLRTPLRLGCFREFQSSIRESVLHLLEEQIRDLGLSRFYRVGRSEINAANGGQVIFKGLRHNVQEVKSTEGLNAAWVEEGQAVSEESWRVLIPTIRRPGSEIWVSFNPGLESDPTYQRFIVKPPPRSLILRVGWEDNPWLPDVLRQEAEELRARDPEAYENVWGGEPWRRSEAEVLSGKWVVEPFEPGADWQGPYHGVDWGFSMDPTHGCRLWVHDGALYYEHEAGGLKLDNDATARALATIPGGERARWYADGARPEMVNEMRLRGLDVLAAPKWTGSVLDGIAHLRTYRQIVIHPRCSRAAREARLWRYKVDKQTGEPLPALVDGNDHAWDAARYALSPLIRRRATHAVWLPGAPDPEDGA